MPVMEGEVAARHNEQGFFHMPKMQVPNYQKSRVHVPFNSNFQSNSNMGLGQGDPRMRQPFGGGPGMMPMGGGDMASTHFDGKRMRKAVVRKTVDYNTTVVKYLETRIWQRDWRDARAIQPDALYQLDMTPPSDMRQKSMNCLTTKFMRQSTNKFRCPIFCLAWTPEGRRLVTGASSGEFTLWNGLTFSFETILQAHETSVRAMVWSHNDGWMVTGDHAGYIKYWQTNMNNVKMYQGHKEAIRSLRWELVLPPSGQTSKQLRSKVNVHVTLPVISFCVNFLLSTKSISNKVCTNSKLMFIDKKLCKSNIMACHYGQYISFLVLINLIKTLYGITNRLILPVCIGLLFFITFSIKNQNISSGFGFTVILVYTSYFLNTLFEGFCKYNRKFTDLNYRYTQDSSDGFVRSSLQIL